APCSHHPERNPPRRASTHTRHLSQLRNQIPDCNRIFRPSQSVLSFLPTVIPLAAGQAAPTAANRIAVRVRLLPRDDVPSEIQNKLPPNAFLDRELRRSGKNLYARHARVWLPWQGRVARRFRVDRANSFRSRNRLDARRPFRSRYRKWVYQLGSSIHTGDSKRKTCAQTQSVRRSPGARDVRCPLARRQLSHPS